MADLDNLLGNLEATEDGLAKNHQIPKSTLHKSAQESTQPDHSDNEQDEITPYERLKRAWMQERACPELLPYDEEVVVYFMDLLASQQDEVDNIHQQLKETPANNNIRQSAASHAATVEAHEMVSSLAINLFKMEIDRVQFILTDLFRTRLIKLETCALFNRQIIDRMSDQEVNYLKEYGKLMERHLKKSVLSHLPTSFARLDDKNMISQPDLDMTVFCKLLVQLSLTEKDDDEPFAIANDKRPKGSIIVTQYSKVRKYVLSGQVLLLA